MARPLTSALVFTDANTSQVNFGNASTLAGLTTFTYAMWVTRTTNNATANAEGVFGRGSFGGNFEAQIQIVNSTNKALLFIQHSTTSVNIQSAAALALNHPYFVLATYASSTKIGQLVLFNGPNGEPELVTGTGVGTINAVGTSSLYAGYITDMGAIHSAGFTMAYAAVFNRVLANNEMGRLYADPYTKVLGLVARYRLGGNGLSFVTDDSGNGNAPAGRGGTTAPYLVPSGLPRLIPGGR